MTYKSFFKWAVVLFSALSMNLFCSCGDDEDDAMDNPDNPAVKPSTAQRHTLSRKTGYGNDWIYFSFAEGKELQDINEDNRGQNLKWDIAFNRYNVRTNSGESGQGKGGALDTKSTDFAAVTSVPAGDFTVDVMGSITENLNSFPPPSINSPLNMLLGDAIEFAGPPPTYTPNNHIYIVRTADGKYAKIQIESFYDDEGNSGFVTFNYVYQPNGSKNF